MSSHLGTTFPVHLPARNPHRPHLRKATPCCTAHITPSGPHPVQLSSAGPEREYTCSGHTAGMGTLVSCFPVQWLFSTLAWPACPGGAQRRAMGHALLCSFPLGTPEGQGRSSQSPVPGLFLAPSLRGLRVPDHTPYIHTCRVVTYQGGVAESRVPSKGYTDTSWPPGRPGTRLLGCFSR